MKWDCLNVNVNGWKILPKFPILGSTVFGVWTDDSANRIFYLLLSPKCYRLVHFGGFVGNTIKAHSHHLLWSYTSNLRGIRIVNNINFWNIQRFMVSSVNGAIKPRVVTTNDFFPTYLYSWKKFTLSQGSC